MNKNGINEKHRITYTGFDGPTRGRSIRSPVQQGDCGPGQATRSEKPTGWRLLTNRVYNDEARTDRSIPMKGLQRIVLVLLVLVAPGWGLTGCFGGPGVEPPFSSESGGEAPPGSYDDLSPTVSEDGDPANSWETDGDSTLDGEGTASGPTQGGEPTGGAEGAADNGGLVPSTSMGDAGVKADECDGGEASMGAADAGDAGDAEWLQDEAVFE